jgi:hypothetical protein
MTISITLGTLTATAKIQDVKNLLDAVNSELALYATKASVDALTARVKALEDATGTYARKDVLADLALQVGAMMAEPDPVIPPDLSERVAALESEPDPVIPPDLSDRVLALENLIQRVPAEAPHTQSVVSLPRPANLPADKVSLIYDKATLYLHDLEMHADRIDESKWRLYSTLNYIVVNPAVWTYDEIVEGTPDEVYAHAVKRLTELAKLKPQHDSVHHRVKEMSEGVS